MAQTTIILSSLALALTLVNAKTTGKHLEGLRVGFRQLAQTAPLILGAFILAGMIEVLVPAEFVQNWLSAEAGIRGILLGSFGGMLLAMGPYAAFPIIGSILASGAGVGTTIALITSWCILGMIKAPFETAFFGPKFFIYKTLCSIPFCIVAGLVGHLVEMVVL